MTVICDKHSRKRETRDKKFKRFDYDSKASNALNKVINDKHVNNTLNLLLLFLAITSAILFFYEQSHDSHRLF